MPRKEKKAGEERVGILLCLDNLSLSPSFCFHSFFFLFPNHRKRKNLNLPFSRRIRRKNNMVDAAGIAFSSRAQHRAAFVAARAAAAPPSSSSRRRAIATAVAATRQTSGAAAPLPIAALLSPLVPSASSASSSSASIARRASLKRITALSATAVTETETEVR